MTEGRLRARVTAWQREQQWAPRTPTPPSKTHPGPPSARQDAAHADAEGRHTDADALRAEADVQTALAATYDQVSRARASWAERTHATRLNAQNALEELARRGITIGDEPDRRTTRQHLDETQVDDAQVDDVGFDERSDAVAPAAVEPEPVKLRSVMQRWAFVTPTRSAGPPPPGSRPLRVALRVWTWTRRACRRLGGRRSGAR